MNLEWTDYRKRQFEKAVYENRGRIIPHGVYCSFIRINEQVGAKLYSSRGERHSTLKMQKYVSNYGLAPQCGAMFQYNFVSIVERHRISSINLYGYLTQIAQPCKLKKSEFSNVVFELQHNLLQIGIRHHDLHKGNIGLIGNQFVCIDFGPEGVRKN